MSFQAYLDTPNQRPARPPEQLVAIAAERGFAGPDTKAGPVVEWLQTDHGLGRGHAAPGSRADG